MKAMFYARSDEYEAARRNRLIFGANLHSGLALDDVVKFVLLVRYLPISAPGRQDINSCTHLGNAQELKISVVSSRLLLFEIGKLIEILHASS